MREVSRGLVAAAAALLAMATVAVAGLLLLGAGRVGGLGALTAAVVALAVGGSAEVGAVPSGTLPVTVRGDLHVLPLGVSLAGAVVLGILLLRRRREGGLLVRGAVAATAFTFGILTISLLAKGTLTMPSGVATGGSGVCTRTGASRALPLSGRLDAHFSVAVGPAIGGALAGALAVAGVCWLITRFPFVATGFSAVRWPLAGIAVVCLAAAGIFGGAAAAGGALLALPPLASALFVPWTVSVTGMLSCAVDVGSPVPWVPVLVLVGIAVAARSRRPGPPLRRAVRQALWFASVTGAVLAVLTLLARVSLEIGVGALGFSLPVLDAQLSANPLLALAAGLAGGAVAGFAGSLLADGISVSSRAWKR